MVNGCKGIQRFIQFDLVQGHVHLQYDVTQVMVRPTSHTVCGMLIACHYVHAQLLKSTPDVELQQDYYGLIVPKYTHDWPPSMK